MRLHREHTSDYSWMLRSYGTVVALEQLVGVGNVVIEVLRLVQLFRNRGSHRLAASAARRQVRRAARRRRGSAYVSECDNTKIVYTYQ